MNAIDALFPKFEAFCKSIGGEVPLSNVLECSLPTLDRDLAVKISQFIEEADSLVRKTGGVPPYGLYFRFYSDSAYIDYFLSGPSDPAHIGMEKKIPLDLSKALFLSPFRDVVTGEVKEKLEGTPCKFFPFDAVFCDTRTDSLSSHEIVRLFDTLEAEERVAEDVVRAGIGRFRSLSRRVFVEE